MKKKLIIIIICILIAVLFFQLMFFNNRNRKNSKNELNEIEISEDQKTLYAFGTYDLFETYKGPITLEEFEHYMYELVYEHIEDIRIDTYNKSLDEIEDYYNQNKEKIDLMGINTKEDFLLIAENIENTYKTDSKYKRTDIDLNTLQETEDGYLMFSVNVTYSNDLIVYFKCYLTENEINEQKIKYTSNSRLVRLKQFYNGPVTMKEFVNAVKTLSENFIEIHDNTTMKSINYQRQYYTTNRTKLAKMGINNQEDFNNFANSINQITWDDSMEFENYLVKLETIENIGDYTTITVTFDYNLKQQFDIKFYLANSEEITPKIKIS